MSKLNHEDMGLFFKATSKKEIALISLCTMLFSVPFLLTVTFVFLKGASIIDWPWVCIFIPLIVLGGIILLASFLYLFGVSRLNSTEHIE